MKKNFLFILVTLLVIFFSCEKVNAAKGLTCIYEKNDLFYTTMLVQHEDGTHSIMLNSEGSKDIDDLNWFDPKEFADVEYVFDSDYANNGVINQCPPYTRYEYEGQNVSAGRPKGQYTFYFYDEKAWYRSDYYLVESYEEANDAESNTQIFDPNKDYTDEINNNEWIGVCKYKSKGNDESYSTLYFNREKMIMTTSNASLTNKITANFSLTTLLKYFDKVGRAPILYQDTKCYSYVGNTFCDIYFGIYEQTNDERTPECVYYDGYKEPGDIDFGKGNNKTTCKVLFSGNFGEILGEIFDIIKFAVPLLIIGLSIVDYVKAVASHNQDDIKKATSKLIKRLIIGLIIFLLPTLIEFFLGLAGYGINDGQCFDWLYR